MQKLITCLLIENDPDNQDKFLQALKEAVPRAGCWVANDYSQALDRMKKRFALVPDYIFMDGSLSFSDVKECVRQFNAAGLHNVCIFVASGSESDNHVENIRQSGVIKVLHKYDSPNAFAKEIRKVILSEW